VNFVYLFFFAAALAAIQCLIGGTRLLFSLPAYGLLAIAAILTLASIRARRVAPGSLCILSTLLLGAWVLIRASWSPIRYLALPDFYMMIGCLTAYLLTACYLTCVRDRTILIGVLWALAALQVFCGLVQFLKDPHFMLFGLMRPVETVRASGLFISPNHFAGFLEAIAIISLSMALWSAWPLWARALGIYMALSCWLGVAISGSRGGYFSTIATLLAFSAGGIYIIRLVNPRGFAAALLGSLAALLLMVGIATFLMSHSQFLSHRMQTMVAKDVRIYNWQAAIDQLRLSPWLGTGSGTHLIYGRLFRRTQIQADPVHVHGDYLELLAEYGIAGGFCMLLFLAAHITRGLNAFSEILRRRLLPFGIYRGNEFALNFGALCAVAGLVAHSVVDFNMHIPGNALLFAFIFGMLANPGIEEPAPRAIARRLLPWGRLVLPALGVWMLCAGLPLLPSEWCAEQARVDLRDNQDLLAIDYANLGLGRFQEEAPPEAPDAGPKPFWASWFQIGSLIRRFGPNPGNPDLYFYLGEANRVLGSRMPVPFLRRQYYEAAIPAFRDGLKVFPQDENALVRMAQCFDGIRQYQAAEQLYQQCFRLDPHLGTLYAYYATHLHSEGKNAEAASAERMRDDLGRNEVDAEQKPASVLK
jgi:O-antigen ligase